MESKGKGVDNKVNSNNKDGSGMNETSNSKGVANETGNQNESTDATPINSTTEIVDEQSTRKAMVVSKSTNLAPAKQNNKATSGFIDLFPIEDIYLNPEKVKVALSCFLDSQNNGIDTVEQAMAAYLYCKELNLPYVSASSHITLIKGKYGLDNHLVRSLILSRNDIYWEILHDYAPLYKYIELESGEEITSYKKPTAFIKELVEENAGYNTLANTAFLWVESKEAYDDLKKKGYTHIYYTGLTDANGNYVLTPIDYVTEIKFTRNTVDSFGKRKVREEKGIFSYQRAIQAGLIDTNKPDSAWNKFTQHQTEIRAFVFGARKIADDILAGMMTTAEILEVSKVDYDFVDGEAVNFDISDVEE